MGKNATECQENVVSGHSDYTFALLARHFTYLYSVFRVLNHGSPAVTWTQVMFCVQQLTFICIKKPCRAGCTSWNVVVRWNVRVFEWSATTDCQFLWGERSSAGDIAWPQHGKPVHTSVTDTSVTELERQAYKIIYLTFWTLGRCRKKCSSWDIRYRRSCALSVGFRLILTYVFLQL